MDGRGALVFAIFCVIGIAALALYYAIKCSRRFQAEAAEVRQRDAEGTEMA